MNYKQGISDFAFYEPYQCEKLIWEISRWQNLQQSFSKLQLLTLRSRV